MLTIIIPRHINRINEIKSELEGLNLNVHYMNQLKINKNTDIYLVNTYGQRNHFLMNVKIYFWADL